MYINAYAMIKDQLGRNIMKWDKAFTCIAHVPISEDNAVNVMELVCELAFLSPWELGEKICPN